MSKTITMISRFLIIGLLLCSVVKAEELTILPFTKGTFVEIQNQHQGKPFVLIFWSESCSYCMKELAMFGRIHRQFPDIELVTVATDSFLDEETVNRVIDNSQLDLKQTWVFADQFPERVYSDVNRKWRGELPVTHFFDRNHKEIRHLGIVEEDKLLAWLNEQTIR